MIVCNLSVVTPVVLLGPFRMRRKRKGPAPRTIYISVGESKEKMDRKSRTEFSKSIKIVKSRHGKY